MIEKKLLVFVFLFVLFVSAYAGETGIIPDLKIREALTFRTSGNKVKLWFDGRIQIDGAAFWGEDYQPLGNGVAFRRVRLGANIAVGEHLSGKIEAGFDGGEFTLRDAFIQYTFIKGLDIRVGNFKEAFSMESLGSSTDLLFLERSAVVSAFAPERHIGLQVAFRRNSFWSAAGIHFQQVKGVKEKNNTDDNNKLGRDEGISYTGRFVWMPRSRTGDRGISLGISASYRTPKNDVDPDFPHSVRFDPSTSGINKIKFVDSGYITGVNHEWRMGAELAGYAGSFRVQGEYLFDRVSRNDPYPTEKFDGFYAQAACLLFGGKQVYSTSRAAFSQPVAGKKWGDLEIAARFDRIDLNGSRIEGGRTNQYTVGVNYYINQNLKVQLNYSYADNDRFANADGKAAVGLDANGAPVYRPDEIDPRFGAGGNDYHSMSLRIQFRF